MNNYLIVRKGCKPTLFTGVDYINTSNIDLVLTDDLVESVDYINITSYGLWLGGGERLQFNILKNTRHKTLCFHRAEGSIIYDNDGRIVPFDYNAQLREILKRFHNVPIILHDFGIMSYENFYDESRVIWYVHGAHVFKMDVSSFKQPLFSFSNYIPSEHNVHPSWANIRIVENRLGVDTSLFKYVDSTKSERLILGIVGRISPEKLPASFFDELSRFQTTNDTRFEFHFYGKLLDGDLFSNMFLRNVNSIENCFYKGEVNKDDIHLLYGQFDYLIVPSQTETGSYVICEAQCSGLSVLALDVDGIPNHTVGNSMLFDDYSSMFNHIKTLKRVSDRERKRQAKIASDKLSIDRWIETIDREIEIASSIC